MKSFFTLTLYCLILLSTSHGQNITFQVQGGTNLTHLSSFQNSIIIVDQGLIIPGILDPSNSSESILTAISEASTSAESGFFISLEASYTNDPENKWVFSSSIGLDLWRYNYDNSISSDNIFFSYIPENVDGARWDALESESLSRLSGSYGEIRTLYTEIQPFNISHHFFQRQFSLQTGPVVSLKIHNNDQKSIAIKYNKGSEHTWEEIDDVYFSYLSSYFNDVLPGWQLSLQGAISDRFSTFVAAKYYFTPSFDLFSEPLKYRVVYLDNQNEIINSETRSITNKGPLPLQFQVGISYDVGSIGKQNKKK